MSLIVSWIKYRGLDQKFDRAKPLYLIPSFPFLFLSLPYVPSLCLPFLFPLLLPIYPIAAAKTLKSIWLSVVLLYKLPGRVRTTKRCFGAFCTEMFTVCDMIWQFIRRRNICPWSHYKGARRPPTLGPSPRTWAIGPPLGSYETT